MNARTQAPPTGAADRTVLWRQSLDEARRVPVKTAAGHAELRSRSRGLSQRHRSLLLWVDGLRNGAALRALAEPSGVPDQCFEDLMAMGLIAWPAPASPPPQPPPPRRRAAAAPDSALGQLLPASGSLGEPSTLSASLWSALNSDSALPWEAMNDAQEPDAAAAQARQWLMDAVRAQAPIAGALLLLRLRRARTRAEVLALLDEVSQRLERPMRTLAVQQLIERVRLRLS